MTNIHPTAVIHPKADLGKNVSVGPYSVIEEHTKIGDGSSIHERATIRQGTTLGKNNTVHPGCILGGMAQHRAAEKDESFLIIGDGNTFREYVTAHRSYLKGDSTIIGNDNLFMAFSHIGHDCRIGNRITIANGTHLGGHVLLEDQCTLSALVLVHQFCRIGALAMIGARTTIKKDVPPYMLVEQDNERIRFLNIVGIQRSNLTEEAKREIKKAYELLYKSDLLLQEALSAIENACRTREAKHLVDFIRQSKRGVAPHRKQKPLLIKQSTGDEPTDPASDS